MKNPSNFSSTIKANYEILLFINRVILVCYSLEALVSHFLSPYRPDDLERFEEVVYKARRYIDL